MNASSDPASSTATWQKEGSMKLNTPRKNHGCVVSQVGDKMTIVVSGGVDKDGKVLDTVELFQKDNFKLGTYSHKIVRIFSLANPY
jgi:hypothetical protein